MKLPARVKTLLCACLLTNRIGYKEEEEEEVHIAIYLILDLFIFIHSHL